MARLLDDALFGPDGTQSLAPLPVLPDPLAGLVTGVTLAGTDTGFDEPGGLIVVPPRTPPTPDARPLRQAVAAVLGDDRPRGRRRPVGPVRPRNGPAYQPVPSGSPVAVAPRPATAPARARRGRGWVGFLVVLIVLGLARYGGSLVNLISRLLHR